MLIDSKIYGKIEVIIGDSLTTSDRVQCSAVSVLGVKYAFVCSCVQMIRGRQSDCVTGRYVG